MNRSLLAALLAATALSSGLAWGQPKDDHGGARQGQGQGQQRQGNRPAQAQHQPQQQAQRQPQAERQPRPQVQHQPQGQAQGQPRHQTQQGNRAQGPQKSQTQARPQGHAHVQKQGAAAPRGGGFSYGGRQHAQIRAPAYSYPQGYGYRRWGVGQDLPLLFLSSQYFFSSYAEYGIGPPPFGFRWVRYGPDLLLVSGRTGRIRQVIYGAFY
jgi:Ni/Co efflux regulator RcnB